MHHHCHAMLSRIIILILTRILISIIVVIVIVIAIVIVIVIVIIISVVIIGIIIVINIKRLRSLFVLFWVYCLNPAIISISLQLIGVVCMEFLQVSDSFFAWHTTGNQELFIWWQILVRFFWQRTLPPIHI